MLRWHKDLQGSGGAGLTLHETHPSEYGKSLKAKRRLVGYVIMLRDPSRGTPANKTYDCAAYAVGAVEFDVY